MKIKGNQIKPGWVIEHQNRIWTVLKTNHVKPGKGGAFCQAEMKEVEVGTKLNERFRADETLEKVMVEEKASQYLFTDGDMLTLMDGDTYEQFLMPVDVLGDTLPFLQDGMTVFVNIINDKPVSIRLPKHVTCTVVETEPVVKGQTAASSNKPAILDNGVRIMVPPFINVDDKIIVNPEESTYTERAKS